MPPLARWLVRTALLYLGLGASLGALLLANKAVGIDGRLPGLLPVHVEWLLVGWMLQLALGVAFWILPRVEGARRRAWLGWASYGVLNAGLGLSTVARAAAVLEGAPASPWLVAAGAAASVAAALAFAAHLWPRAGRLPPAS